GLMVDHDRASASFWDAQTASELRPWMSSQFPSNELTIPRVVVEDILRTSLETTVTGGEAAWRIELRYLGGQVHAYAALDGSAVKVFGVDARPAGVGRHVLRLVARGDLASAGRCLDWVLQDAPFNTLGIARFWGSG